MKLGVGAIIAIAGFGSLVAGVIRLAHDSVGLGLTLGGCAALAVAYFIFKWTPKGS